MPFFGRIVSAALSACEFHFLRYWRSWIVVLLAIVLASIGWRLSFAAPDDFLPGSIVTIPRGSTLQDASIRLANAHIVRNPSLLKNIMHIVGVDGRTQAGAYRFNEANNVFRVAYRLATGEYGLPPTTITLTEGMTVREMAKRVEQMMPEVTAADFISAGQPYEGRLFPDTYRFTASDDADSIVAALRANFTARTQPLMTYISESQHSLGDIVIMASLLEKEANTLADKKMISGILWNRLKRGMPLQVDAVFGYIYGRSTYSPSFSDLGVDSPYNTYTHKGLPPGPISNPGLGSIDAAVHPEKTSALFYLSDRSGNLHAAITYEQHLANQRRYLR